VAERAKRLAQRVLVLDGHVDLPYRLHDALDDEGKPKEDVSKRTAEGDFDFVRAKEGGLDAPFMSIYVPAALEEKGGARAHAEKLIALVEGIARAHPDKFALARSPADIEKNFAAGLVSLPMGMENGAPLEGKLESIRHFHERGIRYVTLAHSKDNHLSDSSYDDRHSAGGLTDFGKKAVDEMNRLGVFVDVSHLSDDAIRDVLARTKAPVIASHSSCRKFTPGWERNISDELIRGVAKTGGVVQINFGSTFVDPEAKKSWDALRAQLNAKLKEQGLERSDEHAAPVVKAFYEQNKGRYATVDTVADHIEHVINLVGIGHVGLGSDFDGVGDSLPEGLKDVSFYPNLFRVLLERGHSEADVEKIAGANVMRAWRRMEAVAAELQAEAK
jgi:membrane dipeptidase